MKSERPPVFDAMFAAPRKKEKKVSKLSPEEAKLRYHAPVLTREQEKLILQHYHKGHTPKDLLDDPDFMGTIRKSGRSQEIWTYSLLAKDSIDDVMVICNRRIVQSVVAIMKKQRLAKNLSYDELIAAGNVGVIKALRRFDSSRDARFISYAKFWIRKEMQQQMMDREDLNYTDFRSLQKMFQLSLAIEETIKRKGKWEELRQCLLVHTEFNLAYLDGKAKSLYERYQRQDVVIDKPNAEGNPLSVRNVLAHHDEDPLEVVFFKQKIDALRSAIFELSDREREIVASFFGFDDTVSFAKLAAERGISPEELEQQKDRALDILRQNQAMLKLSTEESAIVVFPSTQKVVKAEYIDEDLKTALPLTSQEAQMQELKNNKLPVKEIKHALGVDTKTFSALTQSLEQKECEVVRALLANSHSYQEISQRIGIPVERVRARARSMYRYEKEDIWQLRRDARSPLTDAVGEWLTLHGRRVFAVKKGPKIAN